MEEEYIEVSPEHIRDFVQEWLNETKLGEECGVVYLTETQWNETKKNFDSVFEKNWRNNYIVTAKKLFDFINDTIYMIVNNVFEEMVQSGEYDLCWNSEKSDFCLQPKTKI